MLTNHTTEIAIRLYENKTYGKTHGPGLYKKALFNGTIDVKDPCVKFVIDFYSFEDWRNTAKTDLQMLVLEQVTPEPNMLYSWVSRYDVFTKQKTMVTGVCTLEINKLAVTATIVDEVSCIEDAWSMQAKACRAGSGNNTPQLLATNSDLGAWK
jgi:hypothetical protein